MKHPSRLYRPFLVALACLPAAVSAAPDPAASAKEILAAANKPGGLLVNLACTDGRLTAELGRSGKYIVLGLTPDAAAAAAARQHIASEGLHGRTVVLERGAGRLPVMDNSAAVVVRGESTGVEDDEIMRVLAPLGVLAVREQDGWKTSTAPWPEDIDEWTHFLHGPDNNAVARDRVVGPPSRLQWLADPVHLRSHEHLNSISAVVSARGRLFYIIDEGPVSAVVAPPAWRLVARDAFSGALLWKADLGTWEGHFRLFRSGPPEIARRLVTDGKRVYATLGYGKRVGAFDAATGTATREYGGTDGAVEILCAGGVLYVLTGTIDDAKPEDSARRFYPPPAPRDKGLVALDAETGTIRWKKKDKDTDAIMPTTPAVADGRLFFQNTTHIVCLDAASGTEQWRAARPVYTKRLSWSAPTLVVADGVVLSADGSTGGIAGTPPRGGAAVEWILSDRDIRRHPEGDLVALDAENGKKLWTGKSLQGFCNPGDLFVIGTSVWCGADVAPRQALLNTELDLKTGEVRSRRPKNHAMPVGGHTRCWRNKATERYLVMGDIGVEFVDVENWRWNANPWVRGTCQYGVMPCNGLLYAPPDSCACRPEMRLHGFAAMAPAAKNNTAKNTADDRLQKGPAYGSAVKAAAADERGAWPTYRHDAARTGRTNAAVPPNLSETWRTDLGGTLSSPTIGGGKVYLSRVDAAAVCALDADTGRVAWTRPVGSAVDSPPTYYRGTVIFGCRDGRVYCLDADDGAPAWTFRAAPEERYIVAMERVESAWPIHGSVLVVDGRAWLAAGRSAYLDGGIYVYALDAATGTPVVRQRVFARGPQEFHLDKRPRNRLTPPAKPDIFTAAGDLVHMGWMGFDAKGEIRKPAQHLFSATGFLDDTWWHRTYWQYGTWMRGGFGGWPRAAMVRPSGRIMAVGGDRVYGFGRAQYDAGNGGNVHAGHVGTVKNSYQDMGRVDYAQNPYRLFSAAKDAGGKKKKNKKVQYHWRTPVDILARAMVLAGDTLFIAGPPHGEKLAGLFKLGTVQPGGLAAYAAADGKKIAGRDLPADPVFDGMAAANGRLVITCTDGSVCCLEGK